MDWNGIYGRWVKLSVIIIKIGVPIVILGVVTGLAGDRFVRNHYSSPASRAFFSNLFWVTLISAGQLGPLFLIRWLLTGKLPKLRK